MQSMDEWLTQRGGLANRLVVLRRGADVTGREIARQAGWKPPKVSKIERGHQLPTPDEIRTWCRICGAGDTTVTELLALLDEAVAMHSEFRVRVRLGQVAIQRANDDLVKAAAVVRNLETVTVPGLLQVPGYARSRLIQMVEVHGADPAELDAAVAARMARQAVLGDTSKRFEFVITEACLRLMPCDRDTMLAQLDRLRSLTAPGMAHVQLLVLPFGRQLQPYPQHGVLLVDDLAVVETVSAEAMYEGDQAAVYAALLDGLAAAAVDGADARRLIDAAISALA